jgi:hypothetical protein
VKSTYDENLYTKKLDLTKMTKEQVHSASMPPVDGRLSPGPGHSLLHTLLDAPAPLLRPFLLAHAALLYPLSPLWTGHLCNYYDDFACCPSAAMQIKRAEKMAREIEGGASDNIHLQVRQSVSPSVSRSQRRMRG